MTIKEFVRACFNDVPFRHRYQVQREFLDGSVRVIYDGYGTDERDVRWNMIKDSYIHKWLIDCKGKVVIIIIK